MDTINVYMNSDQVPSELELRRILRQIEQLKQADAVEGWLAAAMLAAWQWNQEETIHHTNAAVALAPRNPSALQVASRCLWNAGLYDRAMEFTERAFKLAPNSTEIFDSKIERNVAFGKYSESINLVREAEVRGVAPRATIDFLQENLKKLEAAEVSEERLQQEACVAMNVLAENKTRIDIVRHLSWFDPESSSSCFTLCYVFYGRISQELELEKALALRLMDDEEWNPSRLSTEFEAEPFPQ